MNSDEFNPWLSRPVDIPGLPHRRFIDGAELSKNTPAIKELAANRRWYYMHRAQILEKLRAKAREKKFAKVPKFSALT